MSTKTTSFDRHRIDEMAIALYRAAHDAAVELPRSYARVSPRRWRKATESSACRGSAAAS
jgi:hypothetical protein